MTMADHKCEVCFVNEPIGVASTVMPYSCAYCAECARRFAQPPLVFECMYDDFGTDFDQMDPAYVVLETFLDGKYVDYKTWTAWRSTQVDDRVAADAVAGASVPDPASGQSE